ncbi:hypothetical protein EG329_011483 [Mollisiaceae sp. DMI_Dod_QoI]|nr:hypothetical protein EG329_011483 [Helotiales sp. DMI_Dod_QoI]
MEADLGENWKGGSSWSGDVGRDMIRDEWELSADEFMGKYYAERDDVEDGDGRSVKWEEEEEEGEEEDDEVSFLDEGVDGEDLWEFGEDQDEDEDDEETLTGTDAGSAITGPIVTATESENESESTAETATESEPRGRRLSRRLDSPTRTHDRETLTASQYSKKYGGPSYQIPVWRLRDPRPKSSKKYTSPPPPPSPPIPSSKKARRNKGKGKGKGRPSGANERKERSETSVSASATATASTATAGEGMDTRDEVGLGLSFDNRVSPYFRRLDRAIIKKLLKGVNELDDVDAGLDASEGMQDYLHPDLD